MKIIDSLLGKWFDNRFAENLETHRSKLQTKVYVSKVRFDTEFQIYQKLSLALYLLVEGTAELYSITFPEHFMNIAFPNANKDLLRAASGENADLERKARKKSEKARDEFMTTFYQNVAFIPKEIADKYEAFFGQVSHFYQGCSVGGKYYDLSQVEMKRIDLQQEAFQIANLIPIKYYELTYELREYLDTLEIV